MTAPTSLFDWLIAASVKIVARDGSSEGSGFFVAPAKLLTCAHVTHDKAGKPRPLQVSHAGTSLEVLRAEPTAEDLCLLTLAALDQPRDHPFDHPCVRLDEPVAPRDPLFLFGYPGTGARNTTRGESSTSASDGVIVDTIDGVSAHFIKFVPGAVKPGMSGAALLNERTGSVCGVVKRTRNAAIDQGGLAVSVAHAWAAFPGLRDAHDAWHRDHPAWQAAFRHSGAALQQAIAAGPPAVTSRILWQTFAPLISSRTEGFVGRGFVFDAIDAAIADAPSGYVLVTAEPGLGKTALMAQLVQTRGWVHHFNVTSLDVRTARQFVDNVCGQLIVKYGLEASAPPAALAEYGAYLSGVLDQAAARRGDEPVVILVDAIDEASDDQLPAGANRLFLPRDLPAGVHIVLSSRPLSSYRLVVDRLTPIPIVDGGEGNQRDVTTFISRFIDRSEAKMTTAIAAWGVGEDAFVAALRERSEGNFMYLKHVLQDIADGRLSQATIGDVYRLPTGIQEYYRWHWAQAREHDPAGFEDTTKPVICAFATAKEPVSAAQVVRWTRARWPALDVGRILGVVSAWRQFLDEDQPPGSPPRYRVYHASFKDFLEQVEGLALYDDLIIDSALSRIPGFGTA